MEKNYIKITTTTTQTKKANKQKYQTKQKSLLPPSLPYILPLPFLQLLYFELSSAFHLSTSLLLFLLWPLFETVFLNTSLMNWCVLGQPCLLPEVLHTVGHHLLCRPYNPCPDFSISPVIPFLLFPSLSLNISAHSAPSQPSCTHNAPFQLSILSAPSQSPSLLSAPSQSSSTLSAPSRPSSTLSALSQLISSPITTSV